VVVSARGRRAPALATRLARGARRLLRGLRLPDAELSVLLVSDRYMRAFNRRYRGKDRPTDVLAFAQAEGHGRVPDGLLGDVVLSVDTARRQARDHGTTLARESERLLIHGLLHLLGYDHERSPAEARRMQRRERVLAGWLAGGPRRRPRCAVGGDGAGVSASFLGGWAARTRPRGRARLVEALRPRHRPHRPRRSFRGTPPPSGVAAVRHRWRASRGARRIAAGAPDAAGASRGSGGVVGAP